MKNTRKVWTPISSVWSFQNNSQENIWRIQGRCDSPNFQLNSIENSLWMWDFRQAKDYTSLMEIPLDEVGF